MSSTSTESFVPARGWWARVTLQAQSNQYHDHEQQRGRQQRLNRLRAGVLGANDGIVSVAATVVGVAGATNLTTPVLLAGVAALVGGAISMALGEYVSVSSQTDSEEAVIERDRDNLQNNPAKALDSLTASYLARGLRPATAKKVAAELVDQDPLAAHLSIEHNIDTEDIASPWHAAFASILAFFIGGIFPLLAVLLPPVEIRVAVTFIVVVVALALTGVISARIGKAPVMRATLRVVIGGFLALLVTYGVGVLLSFSGIV